MPRRPCWRPRHVGAPVRASLAAVLLIAAAAAPAAQPPALRPTGAPPPGFEAFFEVQRTVVDVYYGGRFLVATPARYDLDHIEFEDPSEIAAAISDVVDPARIAAALEGELDPHSEAICGRVPRDDCGRLSPEVAAVIFDATRFRATLFVAPDQRAVQGPDLRRFLPPSDSEFSILQNVFASASGSDSATPDAYTITGLTSLAFAETQLLVESSYGSQDAFTVDQAYARREFQGRFAQGGLYRTRGQSLGFVRERDLVGVQFGSSLDTRADRAFSGGTPLEVFLPNRSRVEILQDGRLLTAGTYDAGNRVLDTRTLPEGAYQVTLRIREAGGTVRTEQRLFVKTTRLPPTDQPLWSLEAGRVVDRNTDGTVPEDTGDWFARAGTTRRIAEGLGIDLGIAAGLGDALAEAGAYRLFGSGEIQGSVFGGRHGDYGAAALGRFQWRTLRLNADYRRVEGPDREDRRLTGAAFEQFGASVSTPFVDGILSLGVRFDARGDGSDRTSQTLSWDRELLRAQYSSLRMEFDVSRDDDAWFGLVRLRWDARGAGGLRGSVHPGLRYDRKDGDGEWGAQTTASAAWERQFDDGDYLRLGADGTEGVQESRLGVGGLYEGRFGRLSADVDHSFSADRTSWTGNLNTSALSDGRRISVGGRDQARSAALVEIRGDVPDARFEVLVDGYSRGVAPVGSVTPIHLLPWETYTVRLRPTGGPLLAWENREEQITLYPGNVARLNWEVAEIVVVLGRVVDGRGEPVEQARIGGAYGFAMTETGGWLQAEVVRPAAGETLTLDLVRREAPDCRVSVEADALDVRAGIIRLGTLSCRSPAASAAAAEPAEAGP